jgi:hypothetical protein
MRVGIIFDLADSSNWCSQSVWGGNDWGSCGNGEEGKESYEL